MSSWGIRNRWVCESVDGGLLTAVLRRKQPATFFIVTMSFFTALSAVLFAADAAADHSRGAQWAGTWAAATSPPALFDTPLDDFNDQTLRQIVRVSAGGRGVRVRLSNVHGTAPLKIGAASVAVPTEGAAVRADSRRRLTFGGDAGVQIAAGAKVLSDPVSLRVQDLSDLAISLYLPDGAVAPDSPVTYHVRGLQTSYVLTGNQVGVVAPQFESTNESVFYLSGVDVGVSREIPVVVMLGDSITDGDQSSVDMNQRLPNLLAERLLRRSHRGQYGWRPTRGAAVLNAGISGNQVTTTLIGDSAQARLDRDVLTQTGASHLIVLEGINDLGLPGLLTAIGIPTPMVSAEALIDGHEQIIARARAFGLTVIGATITPSGGSPLPGYNTPDLESRRQTVNVWIRNTARYDAVIDFDRVLRDPDDPTRMRAELTADGLHPNDQGYQAMADAIRLRLFQGNGNARRDGY